MTDAMDTQDPNTGSAQNEEADRRAAVEEHRQAVARYEDTEQRLKEARVKASEVEKKFLESEALVAATQSVGQLVAEVLKPMGEDKYIVKVVNGPRYVVGCRQSIKKGSIKEDDRVALDMTTLTIMRRLPREVNPLIYQMAQEDIGSTGFEEIGGLEKQLRELREVVELPMTKPELFRKIGIVPPRGCLLYGPPGTGKTLLARAIASQLKCTFLKLVASQVVEKYIGESSRLIREIFAYAKSHEPAIIFFDEIDAIGGRRFSEGNSSDREIQRTLMELLNQMDGFDSLGRVKIIMATNRPDTLDPALLRPGRLDRKIEIPLPNDDARLAVLKIHSEGMSKDPNEGVDLGPIVKLSEGFSCADLRNVCTEAGLFAIRDDRDYVLSSDFVKGARKMADLKKLETKINYHPV